MCIFDGILDNLDNVLELGTTGVADGLVQPALARGDDDAFGAEAGEGERDFLFVAAAYCVGEDVDFGIGRRSESIQGSLGDADVGFYAEKDDFCCSGG